MLAVVLPAASWPAISPLSLPRFRGRRWWVLRAIPFSTKLPVPAFGLTACYDREVESEVRVEQDRNLDDSTDTTIKRKTTID